jgi:hypothetical protein
MVRSIVVPLFWLSGFWCEAAVHYLNRSEWGMMMVSIGVSAVFLGVGRNYAGVVRRKSGPPEVPALDMVKVMKGKRK